MKTDYKAIIQNFFDTVSAVISEGSSDKYAAMVLENFIVQARKKYPAAQHVSFKGEKLIVLHSMDTCTQKQLATFLEHLMNSLFSQLFKHLVKKRMTIELYEKIRQLGVKL
jgi:hypothetical protein